MCRGQRAGVGRDWGGVSRTIILPLIPTIKSNHGSIANSRFVFRNT